MFVEIGVLNVLVPFAIVGFVVASKFVGFYFYKLGHYLTGLILDRFER